MVNTCCDLCVVFVVYFVATNNILGGALIAGGEVIRLIDHSGEPVPFIPILLLIASTAVILCGLLLLIGIIKAKAGWVLAYFIITFPGSLLATYQVIVATIRGTKALTSYDILFLMYLWLVQYCVYRYYKQLKNAAVERDVSMMHDEYVEGYSKC